MHESFSITVSSTLSFALKYRGHATIAQVQLLKTGNPEVTDAICHGRRWSA